jgi:hypothetical protein
MERFHVLARVSGTIQKEGSTVLDVFIGDMLVNKYFNNIAT